MASGNGARVIPIRQLAAGSADSADALHERLVREGWRRQTTIGEPRLSELVENYKAMGYEVRVEGYQTAAGNEAGCTTCLDAGQEIGQAIGTVYVRKSDAAPAEDELFWIRAAPQAAVPAIQGDMEWLIRNGYCAYSSRRTWMPWWRSTR